MLIKYFFTVMLVISWAFSFAQSADIQIEIENHESDTLIFGYYFADKILVKDTLYSPNNRDFSFSQDTLLDPGMYLLVSKPSGNYYQMLVPSDDQGFTVRIDKSKQPELSFEGSEENTLFYDYLGFISNSKQELAKLDQALATTDSVMISVIDQLKKDKQRINDVVEAAQLQMLEKYKGTLTAELAKSNLPFSFPEFEGTDEQIQMKKYLYYKEHYFDNVDLGNPALLRTPVLDQRINYYLQNLTPNQADSIIISVDRLLTLMEPSKEAYQYYLSNFLNSYGNSKYIGMDAVYVHLATEYYGKGKAPWVSGENLAEIVDNAKRIKPILIGKQAPDFTVYKQDGTPVSLSDFKKDYTVILFWKPDCSHCSKAMPHLIDFNEKYKDKGVDVLTICTYSGEKYGKCWEDVEAKNMTNLLNAGDEFNKSGVFSNYFTTSTPKIFILDRDKKILLKKVPAENLDAVMIELMKVGQESQKS